MIWIIVLLISFDFNQFRNRNYFFSDHFLIHWSRLIIDPTSSWPLEVRRYSTLGGISLKYRLFKIPFFSSSLKRLVRVLLLKPFIEFLNCNNHVKWISDNPNSNCSSFLLNRTGIEQEFIEYYFSWIWKRSSFQEYSINRRFGMAITN